MRENSGGMLNRRTLLTAAAAVKPHNWFGYDFGPGPAAPDRLYQGPFPDASIPGAELVMATTPSEAIVPNFGMGLMIYLCDEAGPPRDPSNRPARLMEDLAALPMGSKLYIRLNWKDVQNRPGRLDPCEHWNVAFDLARRTGKRIAFRVMMSNPDTPGLALPDFLSTRVPVLQTGIYRGKPHFEPRYDDLHFQAAFRELVDLLADTYNGHPSVEFVDTFMYGYWGEGHSGSLPSPFPSESVAQDTFLQMFHYQAGRWTRTPLATNTQPDMSHVGNAAVLDSTVRSHNWLRTDTIFIENEQIEELGNRPPWIAAAVENTFWAGPGPEPAAEGVTYTANALAHIAELGANYASLWNWHRIHPRRLLEYYQAAAVPAGRLARRLGYRVRPSLVWSYPEWDHDGQPGLIIGFANDGVAAPPGILRIRLKNPDSGYEISGSLDPGHPLPGKIRQARFPLPRRQDWQNLRLSAEIEVKQVRYPVRWALPQSLETDHSLRLRPTPGLPPQYQ